jgi:hypothetical protein
LDFFRKRKNFDYIDSEVRKAGGCFSAANLVPLMFWWGHCDPVILSLGFICIDDEKMAS